MINSFSIDLNQNQKLFLNELATHGASQRKTIVQNMGMSPQTVMRVYNSLAKLGLVEEYEQKNGNRGKPHKVMQLKPSSMIALGISISSTHVGLDFRDLNGTSLGYYSENFKHKTADETLELVFDNIKRLASELPDNHSLVGAYITVQGLFLERGRKLVSKGDPNGWAKIDLKQVFEDKLNTTITVEKDYRVIATSFYNKQIVKNMMCIYLGDGIGAGIIVDGNIMIGSQGNAGEIGYLFPKDKYRPTETDLMKLLSIDSWQAWNGFSTLDEEIQKQLDIWIDNAATAFEQAIKISMALLDFEAVYFCSNIPQEIMEVTIKKTNIQPLSSNIYDFENDQYISAIPELVIIDRSPFEKMASEIAAQQFLKIK